MRWLGFEPAILTFKRAKTVHALDRAVTAIGIFEDYSHYIKRIAQIQGLFFSVFFNNSTYGKIFQMKCRALNVICLYLFLPCIEFYTLLVVLEAIDIVSIELHVKYWADIHKN